MQEVVEINVGQAPRAEKFLATYGKNLLGLTVTMKPVGGGRPTNPLNG